MKRPGRCRLLTREKTGVKSWQGKKHVTEVKKFRRAVCEGESCSSYGSTSELFSICHDLFLCYFLPSRNIDAQPASHDSNPRILSRAIKTPASIPRSVIYYYFIFKEKKTCGNVSFYDLCDVSYRGSPRHCQWLVIQYFLNKSCVRFHFFIMCQIPFFYTNT